MFKTSRFCSQKFEDCRTRRNRQSSSSRNFIEKSEDEEGLRGEFADNIMIYHHQMINFNFYLKYVERTYRH